MFGYIRPEKKSLMVCELIRFKSIYCGLCKQIKRDYGNIPRLTLTYDLTFLASLLISLSEEAGNQKNENCILNPLKRKPVLMHHPALKPCAGIGMLLFAAKLEDDVQDQRHLIGKISRKGITYPILMNIPKLEKRMAREVGILREGLLKLSALESAGGCDLMTYKIASDIFGEVLRQIFGICAGEYFTDDPKKDMLTEGFSVIGFYIGKWIYLIDAIHDYESDVRHKRFNPFAAMDYQTAGEAAKALMVICEDRIDAVAALLPYKRDSGIIRNIIQRGIPAVRDAVLSGVSLEKI